MHNKISLKKQSPWYFHVTWKHIIFCDEMIFTLCFFACLRRPILDYFQFYMLDIRNWNLFSFSLHNQGLGYDGIANLLGLVHTVATVPDALPPPRSSLISSSMKPVRPNVSQIFFFLWNNLVPDLKPCFSDSLLTFILLKMLF